MNTYTQQFSITWDLPFSKVPILNFINLTAGYRPATAGLQARSPCRQSSGNMIENNQTRALKRRDELRHVVQQGALPEEDQFRTADGKEQEKKLADQSWPGNKNRRTLPTR